MALLPSAFAVFRPSFLIAGALVALGTVGAHTVTRTARSRVAAFDFTGADGVYALVGAGVTHALGSLVGLGRLTRPVALGMVATGALTTKLELTE